jgi:hypothetical protein
MSLILVCASEALAQETSVLKSLAPTPFVGDQASEQMSPQSEDWSTARLSDHEPSNAEPIVGQVDDSDPAFTRELTRVQWRAGDPIDLYIIKPKGIKKPQVILYLYSFPSENDRYLSAEFCRFLTRNGFAAIGFNPALTGNRDQGRPMKQWFVSELQESLATSAHDVQLVLNYLATRNDLNVERVGMFGDGSGATIAILAAAVDQRIQALDLLDPWGDWPDWIAKSTLVPEKERPEFLKPKFLDSVARLDPVQWLAELKTKKIRIQDVKSVTVTPTEARERIEGAAPAGTLIVRYEDAKAFLRTASTGQGFDWVKNQLKQETSQESASGVALSMSGSRGQVR